MDLSLLINSFITACCCSNLKVQLKATWLNNWMKIITKNQFSKQNYHKKILYHVLKMYWLLRIGIWKRKTGFKLIFNNSLVSMNYSYALYAGAL